MIQLEISICFGITNLKSREKLSTLRNFEQNLDCHENLY